MGEELSSMPAFQLCADFRLFRNDHPLGLHKLAHNLHTGGFRLPAVGRHPAAVRERHRRQMGIAVPAPKVEITLPTLAESIRARIATFNAPVDIAALDSSGTSVSFTRRRTWR